MLRKKNKKIKIKKIVQLNYCLKRMTLANMNQ